ncbi:MAG: class I SAM-dependent methyltransferase [Bacteroidia bacterium]
MKPILNWQTAEVVNIFDEVSLWAAPFGKLMLDHIPMQHGWQILDIGFGTGFPLIELAQRFGPGSTITGIDMWEEAIVRSEEKARVCGLTNVNIVRGDAAAFSFPDASFDLITSNLGVNNFDKKEEVIAACYRMLKPGGHIAITTNVKGTFEALFDIFAQSLTELNLDLGKLQDYLEHRSSISETIALFQQKGFKHVKTVEDEACFRFVDAAAVFDHSLMRIGFREGWQGLVEEKDRTSFFTKAQSLIEKHIEDNGELRMKVPVVYLDFEK